MPLFICLPLNALAQIENAAAARLPARPLAHLRYLRIAARHIEAASVDANALRAPIFFLAQPLIAAQRSLNHRHAKVGHPKRHSRRPSNCAGGQLWCRQVDEKRVEGVGAVFFRVQRLIFCIAASCVRVDLHLPGRRLIISWRRRARRRRAFTLLFATVAAPLAAAAPTRPVYRARWIELLGEKFGCDREPRSERLQLRAVAFERRLRFDCNRRVR